MAIRLFGFPRILTFIIHSLALLTFGVFMTGQIAFGQEPPQQSGPVAANQAMPGSARQAHPPATPNEPPITESEIRQRLMGKSLYLRGGYLENSLHFDEMGKLDGNAPQASYTLSLVEIDRVKLTKHKLELGGIRYGIHFLGALPTEDPLAESDKVRITPKKKSFTITIERAGVAAQKKEKNRDGKRGKSAKDSNTAMPGSSSAIASTGTGSDASDSAAGNAPVDLGPSNSQAHANRLLLGALDRIFSQGIDVQMMASLPDCWKLYYRAAAAKSDYRPSDPSVLRQAAVDQKAKLLSTFEPPSNDFAQNAGVAGVALYHVVVGADGKPGEIALARPIGFGLDENAVASIRKAAFQPAIKDGKPVPVMLDLLVQFRIFSKRTGAPTATDSAKDDAPSQAAPALPGPYSVNQPVQK